MRTVAASAPAEALAAPNVGGGLTVTVTLP
jgi:hypothetical protein